MDASFDVFALPVFEIVYHHKAGARGSPRSVNADYHEGLELLLSRLAAVGTTILGISVESGVAHALDAAERELGLEFPIPVDGSTDAAILRLTITRAQKLVARRPGAKPGGGNDQKTIRMTISLDTPGISTDNLARLLVGSDTHSGEQEWRAGSARSLRVVGVELGHQREVEAPLNGLADTDSGADSAVHESMTTRGSERAISARLEYPMATKHDLQYWVKEALETLGGTGTVVEVAREIWRRHEDDLRASGDLFYTWQYDMRWAAQALRDTGQAKSTKATPKGRWELAP